MPKLGQLYRGEVVGRNTGVTSALAAANEGGVHRRHYTGVRDLNQLATTIPLLSATSNPLLILPIIGLESGAVGRVGPQHHLLSNRLLYWTYCRHLLDISLRIVFFT